MKKLMLFSLTLAALALPLTVSAAGFEFAVGGWYVNPNGDIGLENDTLSDLFAGNTLVDLNHAGIDKKWQAMFRVKIQPPALPGIYLQATPMSWGNNNHGHSSDFEFAFGNTVFFAGDEIKSEFFLNEYDAALYIPIPLLKSGTLGVVNVEIGAGARWIVLKSGLSRAEALSGDVNELIDTGALEDSQTASVVYPVGYGALMIRPTERVSLEGEIWGWSWNGAKFWTANARLKLLLVGPLYIDGGYREDYYNFSRDDLTMHRAHFKGPYAEVGLQW